MKIELLDKNCVHFKQMLVNYIRKCKTYAKNEYI